MHVQRQTVAQTRENIAGYCANILYGNYSRKQPVVYEIPHALANISFCSIADRIELAGMIINRLQTITGNHKLHSVIIVNSDDHIGHILIKGSIRRR